MLYEEVRILSTEEFSITQLNVKRKNLMEILIDITAKTW